LAGEIIYKSMTLPDSTFTILVNSSDGFEDCWYPFFTLLQKYWPDCKELILLNTEKKQFSYESLNLKCTMVQNDIQRTLTWSECLLAALTQVETPVVLYFQEDYFLHQPVLREKIHRAACYMLDHPDVKHIALTKLGAHGPFDPYNESWLQVIQPKAKYRISTQAALWRVDTLRSYLAAEENGWMFEIYGTWRSWKRKELFLCARFDSEHGGPAIDYLHTGIIKGKWLREIQDVFNANNILIDYSQRGFYEPKNLLVRKVETLMKLLVRPGYFFSQLMS